MSHRILPVLTLAIAATILPAVIRESHAMHGGMDNMPGRATTVADSGSTGGIMLQIPQFDPVRGRQLFASKGCVVCHSIHGVGGQDAAPLDASTMQPHMNPFDFAAKMWRGAVPMIAMQRNELGHQIGFTGQELADIIAFVHDPAEQQKFSAADIPPEIRQIMAHSDDEGRQGTTGQPGSNMGGSYGGGMMNGQGGGMMGGGMMRR